LCEPLVAPFRPAGSIKGSNLPIRRSFVSLCRQTTRIDSAGRSGLHYPNAGGPDPFREGPLSPTVTTSSGTQRADGHFRNTRANRGPFVDTGVGLALPRLAPWPYGIVSLLC
jgi:hypothetical protein